MALDNPLDNLPIKKLNPAPAVEELSKTPTNAARVINGVWTAFNAVMLAAALIFFFNSNNGQRDKDDTYWKPQVKALTDSVNAEGRTIIDLSIQLGILKNQLKGQNKQVDSLKHE